MTAPAGPFGRTATPSGGGARLLAAALFGILLGTSGFTFYYARGLSYLGNDPETCVNCHVMRPQYDAWNRSSHKAAAACNDCHTPHSFAGKYAVKAVNGYHHGKAFTLGGFPDPILIKPMNESVAEANCLRCHGDVTARMRPRSDRGKVRCTDCHRETGHAD